MELFENVCRTCSTLIFPNSGDQSNSSFVALSLSLPFPSSTRKLPNRDLKICETVTLKYNFALSEVFVIIPSCPRHTLLAKYPKNELVREISG